MVLICAEGFPGFFHSTPLLLYLKSYILPSFDYCDVWSGCTLEIEFLLFGKTAKFGCRRVLCRSRDCSFSARPVMMSSALIGPVKMSTNNDAGQTTAGLAHLALALHIAPGRPAYAVAGCWCSCKTLVQMQIYFYSPV